MFFGVAVVRWQWKLVMCGVKSTGRCRLAVAGFVRCGRRGGALAQGKDSPPLWGVEGFAPAIDMGSAFGWCHAMSGVQWDSLDSFKRQVQGLVSCRTGQMTK